MHQQTECGYLINVLSVNFKIEYRSWFIDTDDADNTMQPIVTLQTFAGLEILGFDECVSVVRPGGVVWCATNWLFQTFYMLHARQRG